MNPQSQAPIYFATLIQNPSDPYASQYGGSDRMVTVEVENYGEHKLWFRAGDTLDYLQRNDQITVEHRSGKWKIAKQQTPELLALLRSRAPALQPSPDSNAPVHQANALSPPANGNQADPARSSHSAGAMIAIFTQLRRGLPELDEATIAKLAIAVFSK